MIPNQGERRHSGTLNNQKKDPIRISTGFESCDSPRETFKKKVATLVYNQLYLENTLLVFNDSKSELKEIFWDTEKVKERPNSNFE